MESKGVSRLGSIGEEIDKIDPKRPEGVSVMKNEGEEPPTPNPLSATYQKRTSLQGKPSQNQSDSDN